MPDLCELVAPGHTAIITQECQRGVIGAESVLPELAESARTSGMIDNVARLVDSGRRAGVEIIHHVAAHRSDMRARTTTRDCSGPWRAAVDRSSSGARWSRSPSRSRVADSDIISTRLHGLGPIVGTDIDSILRNLDVTTVVILGVSSNVAIPNAVFDAVNLAYEVVVPRDGIAGVPASYTDTIVDNSLSLVATITTTAELVACWEDHAS